MHKAVLRAVDDGVNGGWDKDAYVFDYNSMFDDGLHATQFVDEFECWD